MQANSIQAIPEGIRELSKRLLQLKSARPFKPLRVHLVDGRVFDIRYPDVNMVTLTWMLIGIPESEGPDPIADRVIDVDLNTIREVEMIESITPVEPPR